jgi:wyosine [tRNA(Phe)-imidazoG37] synthetase (radical SAM superfamily)
MTMKSDPLTYGPVNSRRLGRSLGINIIPAKTCTLDCIYCQCGRTTRKTLRRQSFYPVPEIMAQVRAALGRTTVDCLTFSGEGEPTLNLDIGTLIRRLKKEFRLPVAVITNSTLLTRRQVQRDLLAADILVPSLDAADQRTFARIDRCHPRLRIEAIINALIQFRRRYRGQLWLEIMLVKGVNDSVEHVVKLRQTAWEIRPDKVHINTVTRPPAEKHALPMDYDDLCNIKLLFGPEAEIPPPPSTGKTAPRDRAPARTLPHTFPLEQSILNSLAGRPATAADLACGLNLPRTLISNALRRLLNEARITRQRFGRSYYYSPART